MRMLRIAAVAALWMFSAALVAWLVAGYAVSGETVVEKGQHGRVAAPAGSPSPELMRALMAWAAPRLGLPAPEALPKVVLKSRCELQAIAFAGGGACAEDADGVQAIYDSGVVWLRDDWRADDLNDVSSLLHELVHHMQHHAGVTPVPCKAQALERPAYAVQFAFLEAAGVDPYETIGINDLMLVFVTHCLGQP
jgi:hypothetical protein